MAAGVLEDVDVSDVRVSCNPEHFGWLRKRFSELAARRPEATFGEGFLYAALTLHRDIEPGMDEGVYNPYEALMADPGMKAETMRSMNVSLSSFQRMTEDFKPLAYNRYRQITVS